MNLYEILGVERGATMEEIKKAYRRKAKEAHPDRDEGDHDDMVEINLAYQVLSDPEKRKQYDHTGEAPGVELTLDERAHSLIARAFDMLLADDVRIAPSANVIERVIEAFKKQVIVAQAEIDKAEIFLRRLTDKEPRVLHQGDLNMWLGAIEERRQRYRALQATHQKKVDAAKRAVEILQTEYQSPPLLTR